ncbi:hypothetical protein BDDG_05988 [Blastomyces dermatitidis ATCC 18188]|uniref:Uncharacterized protein n=1 Tax=Ajellomyces dermatitidis (strain ATCC 18188 / CBS 674.68) TaxID=653446 RepID=F2TII1_AJEDA|nr:hypothetical protein BDDG_05988 [Blastomyces dermatitidis ATCC 18188]
MGPCRLNSAASQAGLRCAAGEKLQIKLLRATVSRIKLSPGFSLNDHTGSYTTVLTERGGSVTTAAGRAEDRLNADTLTGRITAVTREAEEDVIMRVKLSQLIDTVSAFNLAFFAVTEAAATSQRHLFTRKCQNKSSIILQE